MKNSNQRFLEHQVEIDDTIYKIAAKYNTAVSNIIASNPTINPFLLENTSKLFIPLDEELIKLKDYDYNQLNNDIIYFNKKFPFLETFSIGKSVQGREIHAIRYGKGKNCVIYNAAHHGNEWITSMLLMKWIENLSSIHNLKGSIKGYFSKDLYENYQIICIPMVNPDGVEIAIHGFDGSKNQIYKGECKNWKANYNGVDLNRNYDAGWQAYKRLERKLGIFGPGLSGYAGDKPFSEPETFAMAQFTTQTKSKLSLSLHSQGKAIFWQYLNVTPKESNFIANELSRVSGYALENENFSQVYAGYKDWYIQKFSKPGFTIEVGAGINPLPLDQFDQIYEDIEELLLLAAII